MDSRNMTNITEGLKVRMMAILFIKTFFTFIYLMFIRQFKVHTASAIHRDKTELQVDILKKVFI